MNHVARQWVQSLKAGERVEMILGVYDIGLARYNRTNRTGDQYLRMVLGDRTGTIEARIWDTETALQVYRDVRAESLVLITGSVQEYNGLQIVVSTCRPVEWERVNVSDYRPEADTPIETMWKQWDHLTQEISAPHWKELHSIIWVDEFRKKFAAAPAGRQVHHNYGGGLLEHTLEVMQYCRLAGKMQGKGMNGDLLLSGAMLHDVGKVEEYRLDTLTFQITESAKLLGGHIMQGRDMIRRWIGMIPNFPEDDALALEHMVLSHHGLPEWGSSVPPKTLEAICLHQADLLSARLNQAYRVVSSAANSDGIWTSYDRYLGRSLLIPDEISSRREENPE